MVVTALLGVSATPVSLARWAAEKDGQAVYEQCVTRAYKGESARIGVPASANAIPRTPSSAKVDKRKAELREQVERLRSEATT